MAGEQKIRIARSIPGTVPRFFPLIGYLYEEHLAGISASDLDTCQSAGAIARTAMASVIQNRHTNENCAGCREYRRVEAIVANLTPSKIAIPPENARYSFTLLKWELIAVLGILAIVIPAILFIHRLPPVVEIIMYLALYFILLPFLYRETRRMIRELRRSKRALSPEPLRKLLLAALPFREFFSDANNEIAIITTDVEHNEPKKFLYPDPAHNNPDNPEHCERLVHILLASAGLPEFGPEVIDDRILMDGEIWTDFAINHMRGYDRMIRLDFWDPLFMSKAPENWFENYAIPLAIMRDRITALKQESYQDKQEILDLKRELNRYRPVQGADAPDMPHILYVRASRAILAKMPRISMTEFKKEDVRNLIEFGREVFRENKSRIERYIETGEIA